MIKHQELKCLPLIGEEISPQFIDAHVGRQLKLARLNKGMSQQKLADRIGISFQQVQKYERGNNRLSASKLYLVALVLEQPISYFFKGLPEKEENIEISIHEETLHTKESADLIRFFYRINDLSLRAKLLGLLRALVQEQE